MKTRAPTSLPRRPFSIAGETSTRATPQKVVRLLHEPDSWPLWQREIVDAEGPTPLTAGDVVRGNARMLGFGVQGHATAIEVSDRCLEKDVIVGVRMRIRVEVDDSVTPARVGYNLVADLPDGPLGSLLAFFLKRRFKKMQSLVLAELAKA